MKISFHIAVVGLFFYITSCTSSSEGNTSNTSNQNPYSIELENNEKWEVNQEMMIHINNMETDIKAASAQPNEHLNELGEKLNEHIGLLTSNCTMTGKAHDELHKWLVPFINFVKELNAATSEDAKKQSLQAIEDEMNEFHTYFK